MSGTPRLPKTRSTRFIRTTRTKTRRNSKPSVKKKRPNLRRTRLRGHRGGGVKAYLNKHRKGGTLGFTKTDIPVADRPGYVVRISGNVDDNAVIQQMNRWEVNSDGFVVPCPELWWGEGLYFKITTDKGYERGLLTQDRKMFLDHPFITHIPSLFDKVVNMYEFDVLGGYLHTNFVRNTFLDKTTFAKMAVTLVSGNDNAEHNDSIIDYYKHRHPIHMKAWKLDGDKRISKGTYSSSIETNQMKTVLKYDLDKASEVVTRYAKDPKYRFGVLGWTPVHDVVDIILTPKQDGWKCSSGVWFLHIWGVNCESVITQDYKFCTKTPHLTTFENEYEILLKKMFSIIKKAVEHLKRKETDKPIVLRITKLGFGAWATTFKDDKRYVNIIKSYIDHLKQLACRLNNVFVLFADYHEVASIFNKTYIYRHNVNATTPPWTVFENHADPFGTFDRCSNLSGVNIPPNSVYLIVNAWDEGSFIGNGCSLDNSMDGWTVAGNPYYDDNTVFHYAELPSNIIYYQSNWRQLRLGAQCENASFLHNAVFQKTLQQEFKVI